ncbi:DUF742 domain-containing protein [Streptomyces sp. RP5T]|uniref:DUF742 domain-containing protein n=1 Tax=Streptomyces sp. RP5T TaxID=2490848 RepID=UPI000F64F37E|nr:DUF742 domain-containing protein [Streptomyces sp. RP5T]RRR69512.1 DUF742 domain-containing protein [Streptomyces sp. RP5T]
MTAHRPRGDRLVRTYVVTGGRSTPTRNTLDQITLISLSSSAPYLSRTDLNEEQTAALGHLAHGAQSVIELGALLHLPLPVVRVLLCDLLDAGHVTASGRRITDALTERPDRSIMEAVLAGLRRL